MFWLRWCESEDHMQMIMREMYKHWAWAQRTNYTQKTTNTQYTVFISACVHHSLHTNTHTYKIQLRCKTLNMQTKTPQDMWVNVLLFVAGFPGLTAAVLPVRGWDGVNRGALFAGGMGGVGRMGQACPGLACIVVKLHEAEDQVCGHELKLIRWVRDHIPAQKTNVQKD